MNGVPGCVARSGHRAGRVTRGAGLLATAVLVVASCVGCGFENKRGVEPAHLRDLARRVEGGGAECPLSIPSKLLRPSTVARDTPVVPLRTDGPGSDGVVGKGLPTRDSATISCRYQADDVAVTLTVAAVPQGHAIAVFADRLAERGDTPTVLTFIDVNGDLPVGRSRALPGRPPAAFARGAAATGDIALVLGVDRIEPVAELPPVAEFEADATAIAGALAD
jgi:hypothetical protein